MDDREKWSKQRLGMLTELGGNQGGMTTWPHVFPGDVGPKRRKHGFGAQYIQDMCEASRNRAGNSRGYGKCTDDRWFTY